MKKLLKWIKKNLVVFILSIISLILLGIFIWFVCQILSSSGSENYDNRIDNETYVMFTEDNKANLVSYFTNENVENVKIEVLGKMVKVFVYYNPTATKEFAIKQVNESVSVIDETVKSYYDFQYFLISNTDSEIFPIIGSLHKSSVTVSW